MDHYAIQSPSVRSYIGYAFTIARGMTMLYTHGYPINNLGSKFDFIGTGWFWECRYLSGFAYSFLL